MHWRVNDATAPRGQLISSCNVSQTCSLCVEEDIRIYAVHTDTALTDLLRGRARQADDAVLFMCVRLMRGVLEGRLDLTLAAVYAEFFAKPMRPATLEALTMLPLSFTGDGKCISFVCSGNCKGLGKGVE